MTTQPEALRLADAIDKRTYTYGDLDKASVELRRLHALNQELLKALKYVTLDCENVHHSKKDRHSFAEPCPVTDRIRAAIAKAEGEKK